MDCRLPHLCLRGGRRQPCSALLRLLPTRLLLRQPLLQGAAARLSPLQVSRQVLGALLSCLSLILQVPHTKEVKAAAPACRCQSHEGGCSCLGPLLQVPHTLRGMQLPSPAAGPQPLAGLQPLAGSPALLPQP